MPMSQEELREEFLALCDDTGRRVYLRIFRLVEDRSMPLVHFTPRGFTLWEGTGKREVELLHCYHRESDWDQSMWATFGYPSKRNNTGMPDEVIDGLLLRSEAVGFIPTPEGTKFLIPQGFTDDGLDSLMEWLESVSDAVRLHRAS